MVSLSIEGTDPRAAGEVGTHCRSSDGCVGREADENQVGNLQRRSSAHLAESGAGQEDGPLFGVHYRPRTGASAGTESQRPLRRVDGSVPALMAAVPRRAEPFAAGAWGVGVLVGAWGVGEADRAFHPLPIPLPSRERGLVQYLRISVIVNLTESWRGGS